MKKTFTKTKAILFILVMLGSSFVSNAQDYQKRVFRFKFNPSQDKRLQSMKMLKSAEGVVQTGISTIDKLSEKFGVSKMRRVFPYAGKFEAKHRKYGLHLWYEVVVNEKTDVRVASKEYAKLSEIAHSELILKKSIGGTRYVSYKSTPEGTLPGGTNDPLYPQQWHYNNTGQSGGTVDADIDLPEAWTIETGNKDVIVSVHDGGIDYDHQDLAGNMWVNSDEIAGNGIDDDDNGYVDDIYGYNFGDGTGTIYADDHGTHVSGTIAAETNNGLGMSGIAGGTGANDGIRLMSCEVFGQFDTDGFAESYIYAADNGAVISQNSWGYNNPGTYEQAVMDAIDYFIAEAGKDENGQQVGPMAGGLVIFAAGNDGTDDEWYPGYYNKILSVAGTNHNDNKYTSSNHGAWVDIAAPAVNVYSTIPNNQYTGGYNGTSMACPHVSGTAALILSHFKDDGITPQQIWDRLVSTTDPLTFAGAEGWGSGRLNTFKALAENDGIPPLAITDLAVTGVSSVSVSFSWTAPADQPGGLPVSVYDFRYSTSPITASNFSSASHADISSPKSPGSDETVVIKGLNPGTSYYFAVKSADFFGNTSEISNAVTATTSQAPVIVISGKPDVTIDMATDPTQTGTFTISNQGQAQLAYSIFPIYAGRTLPSVTSTLIFPGNKVSLEPKKNYEGLAKFDKEDVLKTNNGISQSFDNDIAQKIGYDDGDDEADGSIAVTANGTPVEWSAATAFIVPDLDGSKFVLSAVSAYIKSGASSQPTGLAIIKGGETPSKGEVLLVQEFPNENTEQYISVPLELPLTFNTGDKFWVVFNFPAAPMRMGYDEVDGGNRPGAYLAYFNDTWADLQSESGWEDYVWTVRAIQTQLQGLTLSADQGIIQAGSSQNIDVNYDATGTTRNGDYHFNIFVSSNDLVNPVKKIEAKAVITGIPEPNIDINPDSVNSSVNVQINPVKTEVLTISNTGTGELQFDLKNPIEITSVKIPKFTGVYPKGSATSSSGPAPRINSVSNSSIPVAKFAGSTAYAHEVYPGGAFVSFSTNSPSAYLTSQDVSYTAYAGDFAKDDDKNLYIIDVDALQLKKLNIQSGAISTVGGTMKFSDLATDKKTGKVYATYYVNPTSDLYQLDLSTGGSTKIGTIGTGIFIAIACDGKGNLWALNVMDDNIYSVNKTTGQGTVVGSAGFDANYAQGMSWDPKTDIIYLSAFNNAEDRGELRILDTQTGATQLVGVFPGGAEVTTLGFPGGGTPSFVTATPTSGTVAAGSSQNIEVKIDANSLTNGIHNSSLTVYSNDYKHLSTTVPVNVSVSGQIGEISLSSEFLEFGTVFINGQKEIPFVIKNTGIGDLKISPISSNIPYFTTDLTDTARLNYGDSITVKVKCAPTFLGQFNGILTVKSNDPHHPNVQVTLTATAIAPPVISLNPESVDLTLNAGQKTTKQFTIKNYGLYPLQFSLPTVASLLLMKDESVQKNNTSFIEGLSSSDDKELNTGKNGHPVLLGAGMPDDMGYRWIDSREAGGPVYNWEEISATGTEILANSDDSSVDIELPFGFKFYGEVKNTVKIGSNGYLTFGATGTEYSNDQIPVKDTPNDFIAPFWDDLRPSARRGQVFYKASAEKLIVQYQSVGNYPSSGSGTITFQVVLLPNGNINYYYKDISLSNNASATIGTENADGTVGSQVAFNTNYVENNLAVLIFPGRTPFDVTVDKVSGIIQPNSQQLITVNVDATELNDGNYINELLISSNDPINPEMIFTTKLDVIGHPKIEASPNPLGFSAIFQGLSEKKILTISNTGSKDLVVTSINSNNAAFITELPAPLTIAPDQSKTVEITFNANTIGVISGVLTIVSNDDSGNANYNVSVTGTGLIPPVIGLTTTPSPAEFVLNEGETDTLKLAIRNTGGSPLNYVMIRPYYSNVGDIEVTTTSKAPDLTSKDMPDTRTGSVNRNGRGGPDSFGYTWVDSDEGVETQYSWIEIKNIGTKLALGGDDGTFIDLPFEFPFYNNKYSRIQVASNGFLTFGSSLGEIGGFSNQDIPNTLAPNNLIAPLWDDIEPQKGDGVYLYSTPDYVIVEYNEVPAFLSTAPATFQAILYPNGNVKFQYKNVSSYAGLKKATVGIENEDGTGALKVVFNADYLKNNLAVLIKGSFVSGIVDPGTTANVDLIIDTENFNDGVYESSLKVLSNDPENPAIEIPTKLTVLGTPEMSLNTDTVAFGDVFYVPAKNLNKTQELSIENSGSKQLFIDSLWFETNSAVFTADLPDSIVLAPNDTCKLVLKFTPDAVGTFANILHISSNDPVNPLVNIELTGNGVQAPILSINPRDTLKLNLKSSEIVDNVSVVSNSGGSVLKYTANVVYLSELNSKPALSPFVRTKGTILALKAPAGKQVLGQKAEPVKFDVNFTDSILFDPDGLPDDYYGYNGTAGYSSANRFIVNSSTFNLTHVANYYQNGGSNTPVIMEVYKGGNLPGQGILLCSQSFTHPEAADGANILIELNESQSFLQNDTFFVVFHYPSNIDFPAGFNSDISGVDGVSYWYNVNTELWLSEDPGYVYKIRAYQATGSAGGNWLRIDPVEGEIVAGASINHTVTANAIETTGGTHNAKIVYYSNDPVNPILEWPVKVFVNSAPEITLAPDSAAMDEGQVYEAKVIAVDPDGGILQFALANTYNFTEMFVNGDTATIVYRPDFTHAGVYDFKVTVTDDKGESVDTSWTINVQNVNRGPILLSDIENKIYSPDDATENIDLSAYFNDPDGETLVYEAFSSSDTAYNVLVNGHTLSISPYFIGSGVVTILAKDPYGAYAASTFNVKVTNLENHVPVLVKPLSSVINVGNKPVVIDLNQNFKDIDGDELVYSLQIMGNPSVIASIKGSKLTLTKYKKGLCVLTIFADDQRGGMAGTVVGVFVNGHKNSMPYQKSEITRKEYKLSDGTDRIDLTSLFADPDNDALTFIVATEEGSSVMAKQEGNLLDITPLDLGETSISIFASDEETGVVKVSFVAEVKELTAVPENLADKFRLTNYPNPFSKMTTIAYELEKSGNIRIEVLNIHGKLVDVLLDEKKQAGKHTLDYNVNGLPAGIYIYKLTVDSDKSITKRMIIE